MHKIVSVGKRDQGPPGSGPSRRFARSTMLSAWAGALVFWLGAAHAGNVQFSRSTPVVLETDPVLRARAASEKVPPIRRGREVQSKARALAVGEQFAPQPNSLRAVMPPVTASDALEHDAQVAREMPAGLNASGAIETPPKINAKRAKRAPEAINLQSFAEKKTAGREQAGRALSVTAMSAAVTGDNNIVTRMGPIGPASLDELARALRNHPDLIYQYVRNNIELDPVRGIHKGALGAVLDNYGSPADQAALMQSLLRLSGFDARIVRGVIKLTAQQFSDWFGVPTGNVCAVVNLLGQAQIPIYDINAAQAGSCPGLNSALTDVAIEHVWVKTNIGGTWYEFDPSYKPHVAKPGIDLAAATGYSAATFLQDAKAGATITPDLVRGLNRTNIRAGLDSASKNLANWIRKNKPTATLDDIVGGKAIVPFYAGALRQTENPLMDKRWIPQELTDFPAEFKPTVRLQYQGIDQTFTSDAIYGRRLTITYNTSNQPVLKLDGQPIGAPGTAVMPGADSVVSFVIWHNAYANKDSNHAFEQHIKGGGKYLIVNGWGPTGRGLSQHYLRNLEELRATGNADDSEAVLGASLGVMGAQWVSQTTNSASITDRLANAYTIQQHQVGIAGYTDGPYVDLPSNMSSTVHMAGDTNLERAVFDSSGMHLSILESTAVNQTSGVSAVSTVKLMDLAMSQGQTIYSAQRANFAGAVKPALQNCQAQLANFEDYLNQGYRLLVPGNCRQVENRWTGTGYFVRGPQSVQLLGSTISGGYSGGFFTSPVPAPTYNSNTVSNSRTPFNQTQYFGPQVLAGDPIDMVHGNFLYERQDLKTGYGASPDSLSFQRFYSSGQKNQTGPLGKGWTHNYDIRIRTASDGFLAMGDRLALDAVGTIVEHKVSLDLLNDPTAPAEKFLSAVIAQRWFGEQLVDNARIVKLGINSDVFSRINGEFSAPPGKAVRLSGDDMTGWTYTGLTGASYTFKDGKVTRYSQPDGKTIDFTWSGDLLTRVENSMGRSLTLAYSNGKLQTVTSPLKTVRYAYDTSDNLVSMTDPDGFVTGHEYDKPGRMTKFYDPAFPGTPVVTNVYDSLDRIKTQTSAAGNLFDYYFAGYRSEEIGPGGSARTNYIDSEGNLLQVSDPVGNWTLKDYDGQNRLVREERPEGNRTAYVYDDATCGAAAGYVRGCTHNVASVSRYPRAGTSEPTLVERFTYHPIYGKVATATDARGGVTQYAYNSVGLVTQITKPAVGEVSPVTTSTYETVAPTGKNPFFRLNRVVEKIDATRTTATTIAYGADYTPATTTLDADGLKVKTVTTYDTEGRLTSSQSDGAPKITYAYDKRDNVTSTNASLLGADETIGYDRNSREVSRGVPVTGGAMVTCKRYNAMGKVVRVWGPAKTTGVAVCPAEAAPVPMTDTAYDDHHRPNRVTQYLSAAEGGNRVTETTYYANDRVNSVRKAVGTGLAQTYATYVYNPNGTVAITTDARGNATVNLYDGHDRLYRTHYPLEGAPGMGDANNYEQYGWDANGNMVALRKRDGQTVTQTFDELNRLSSRTYPGNAGNVQYSYDLRGLKTASQYGDGSHTITNSYDGLGQLTQTSAAGRLLRYSYDTAGRVTDVAWPDGFHVGVQYDAFSRPSQLLENGAVSLAKYSYDTLGRRVQVDLGNGTRTEFAYDNQGFLSGKNHRFTSSAEDWIATFTRNQKGDITKQGVTNNRYGWTPVVATSAYTVNALNQYATVSGSAVKHDLNGNLTGDGVWTYTYDLDNRMKTANRSGTSAALGYDPEGRLVKMSVNGVDTVLLYNGQNLAAEYDGTGAVTRRYVFGPGVDEPLVQYEGASTTSKSWLYANQQGSVVALANGSGATTSSQAYGPFGETNGTPASRFGYTGQQYLAPLGLYYYKARMYSLALGRFLQTDPIGYKDDLNWYAYVGNNPVNLTDPTGMIASASGSFANASSTAAANVAAQLSAGEAKLDGTAIAMPKLEMGEAIQVAGNGGDRMGGNQRENKQFQDVVVKLRLNKSQAQELHSVITKQGFGYHEILQIGIDMFGK
ncbi:RHS repeat-associated core domain-containing protein [Burkholderia ubonensis]|uniref:RHS repeat-associated core domain-containing protein n=1 Tax=Burkholderia ubonensis TaxID=101571 RepID=UPI0009B4976E|nr:RHS repeat-associated core domain-containing protein [Burkholderia ubonensis]